MSDTDDQATTYASYKDDPEFLPWLRTQDGFRDLFDPAAAPKPKVPAPTSGGGENVPANQLQEKASDLVAAITKAAIAEGRREGTSTTATVNAATAPPAATKPQSAFGAWLFGKADE